MVRAKCWFREALVSSRLKVALALFLATAGAVLAAGSGTPLDDYLAGLKTWSADFTQSVAQDSRGKESDAGRGRLTIVKPDRFRWEFTPPGAAAGAQLMVADGRDLWSLDRDLEQATRRPLKDALQQAPVMLLAGDANLQASYNIQPNGSRDGLEWARVIPKDKQSDVREALFGFKGKELARLVIIDKLGQRSTLVFTNVKRNATVDPKLVEFTLPPGVDLIGEPVK
jgi:outer membrane lipoprotein carrier protein